MVRVKICGITNEEDALLAVALGADAVGFVFAPSPRQIAVQKVHDITRRLPPEILTVGVFRDEHPDRVIDIVDRSGVKAAQLHGHETEQDVAAVPGTHAQQVLAAFLSHTSLEAGEFEAAAGEDALQLMKVPFDDKRAVLINELIHETIYHAAMETSMELAK